MKREILRNPVIPIFQPQKHESEYNVNQKHFSCPLSEEICFPSSVPHEIWIRCLRGKIATKAQMHERIFFVKFDDSSNFLWGTL